MRKIEDYLKSQSNEKSTKDITLAVGYKAKQVTWILHCLNCMAIYGDLIRVERFEPTKKFYWRLHKSKEAI